MRALSNPGDALALEVTQDFPSGIVPWRTGDAASRMASRTAQIETRDRTSIIRVSISRVSAPDVEALVCNAVKQKKQSASKIPERELLQRHVERVTVHPKELKIMLRV